MYCIIFSTFLLFIDCFIFMPIQRSGFFAYYAFKICTLCCYRTETRFLGIIYYFLFEKSNEILLKIVSKFMQQIIRGNIMHMDKQLLNRKSKFELTCSVENTGYFKAYWNWFFPSTLVIMKNEVLIRLSLLCMKSDDIAGGFGCALTCNSVNNVLYTISYFWIVQHLDQCCLDANNRYYHYFLWYLDILQKAKSVWWKYFHNIFIIIKVMHKNSVRIETLCIFVIIVD